MLRCPEGMVGCLMERNFCTTNPKDPTELSPFPPPTLSPILIFRLAFAGNLLGSFATLSGTPPPFLSTGSVAFLESRQRAFSHATLLAQPVLPQGRTGTNFEAELLKSHGIRKQENFSLRYTRKN